VKGPHSPSLRSKRVCSTEGALPVPIRFERDNPYVDLTIMFNEHDQIPATVVVDTGASYYSALLLREFIATHHVMDRIGTATRPGRPKGTGGMRFHRRRTM